MQALVRRVLLSHFLNRKNSLFDVGRSMFDVRRSSVSFSIRPTVFFAGGGAEPITQNL